MLFLISLEPASKSKYNNEIKEQVLKSKTRKSIATVNIGLKKHLQHIVNIVLQIFQIQVGKTDVREGALADLGPVKLEAV